MFHITHRAVEQFSSIARVGKGAAFRILADGTARAQYVRALEDGRHLWRSGDRYKWRFVVADPTQDGHLPAVIAVLGAKRRGQ